MKTSKTTSLSNFTEGHNSLIMVQTRTLTERVRGDHLRSAINKCCLTELAWELCAALEHGKEGEKPWCTYGSPAALPRFDRQHTRLHRILAEDLGAALPVNGWDWQHCCYSGPVDHSEVVKYCVSLILDTDLGLVTCAVREVGSLVGQCLKAHTERNELKCLLH